MQCATGWPFSQGALHRTMGEGGCWWLEEKGGNGVVKGNAAGVAPVVDALTMAAAHEK